MRNYLLHFSLASLFVLLPFLIFAWWAEPINGDLTRIGKWTEHDFGPNATHPQISVKANGRFLVNQDVMVLGDSFSGENLWQSVLADNTGRIIKSFHYDHNCIANWVKAAINERTNKIIIIEVVERDFVKRFGHMSLCPGSEPIPLEVQAGIKGSPRPTWPPTLSMSYLGPAVVNTAELNFSPKKHFQRFTVVNTPLKRGCANFSSRQNDRLLYYAEDDSKQQWSAQAIGDAITGIAQIQQEVERSGKKFIFVIAPDKSSVYQNCFLFGKTEKDSSSINKMLIDSGIHAPDLTALFKGKVGSVIDLYDPDNTHWSEAGYMLLGEELGRYIANFSSGI